MINFTATFFTLFYYNLFFYKISIYKTFKIEYNICNVIERLIISL